MNSIIKNKNIILITTIIFFISIFACEKNATEPKEDIPPPLPPVESMQLDLSFFNTPPNNSLAKTGLSKHNFIAAALRVLIIKTAVTLAAIVPTAIFVAALNQDPVLQEDGKFHWVYTHQNESHVFIADLAGWIDMQSTEFVWEMYISSNTHSPKLDHFLWYEGRSRIGNKEGWWLFYNDKSPDSLIEVLKVDWKIPEVNQRELILSNVKQSSNDYGDTLKYSLDDYDNYLIFYDASEVTTSTIYWDSQTGAGYIEWFDYKDGARSYWDENQNDIPGPPA